MLRKAVLAAALLGMAGGLASGVAGARDWNGDSNRWNDSRHDERRDDRRDDRRDERRDQRRDYRHDERRWSDHGQYGNRWQSAPRHVPAPRYYGYAPQRRDWREPYGRGYRYWRNDRYYYSERGRPDVELSFVLPLR
jgi:hypothetical protein